MKVKTSELFGLGLDWATAQAAGRVPFLQQDEQGKSHPHVRVVEVAGEMLLERTWNPSGDKVLAEQLFEHQAVETTSRWCVNERAGGTAILVWDARTPANHEGSGRTRLIAALRCVVASVFGATVDIPRELA